MSSRDVACPVCDQRFAPTVISAHVNSCLNDCEERDKVRETTSNRETENKKRKSSEDWDFLKSSSKSTRKEDNPKASRSDFDHDDGLDLEITSVENPDGSKLGARENKLSTMKVPVKTKSTQPPSTSSSMFKVSVNKASLTQPATGSATARNNTPLAAKMRPSDLDNFIGQTQAVKKNSLLYNIISHSENVPSMIFWGPPGCGKTTLAKIVGNRCKQQGYSKFVSLSATSASVSDVKQVASVAVNDMKIWRRKTILFLDEIHRFNKLQQDSLLPHVENGTLTLIGATTENPSFQVNSALLSRCRVIVLEKLSMEDIKTIIRKAVVHLGIQTEKSDDDTDGSDAEEEVSSQSESHDMKDRLRPPVVTMETEALDVLAGLCDGDARSALNGLQLAWEGCLAQAGGDGDQAGPAATITVDTVKEALQRSHVLYDKTGEEHFNTVSAMIKSLRGSDADAALYWAVRMLEGGENPLFVARRLVVFASEDVGLADPQALTQAMATHQACQVIGMPECAMNLTQCVIYLARAPKSAGVVMALQAARDCVKNHQGALPPVPLHLRNASTKFLANLGYGKGYKYPPAFAGPVDQDYLPPSLKGVKFVPT